jgi:hypothetical protein
LNFFEYLTDFKIKYFLKKKLKNQPLNDGNNFFKRYSRHSTVIHNRTSHNSSWNVVVLHFIVCPDNDKYFYSIISFSLFCLSTAFHAAVAFLTYLHTRAYYQHSRQGRNVKSAFPLDSIIIFHTCERKIN